jgi:hypothetical protein
MFPLVKSVDVIGGALLLSNHFVPLALAARSDRGESFQRRSDDDRSRGIVR